MKKYILCRFDLLPNPQVTNAIVSVAIPNKPCLFAPIPGAFITVFESEKSFDEVNKAIAAVPHIHYTLSELGNNSVCTLFPQQTTSPLEQLQQRLEAAMDAEDYITAAQIRDQIRAIK